MQQKYNHRKVVTELGASMVELAISLLLILAVIAGVVDFSYSVSTIEQLHTISRDVARSASIEGVARSWAGGDCSFGGQSMCDFTLSLAEQSLQSQGFNPQDFSRHVSIAAAPTVGEGPTQVNFNTVTVEIQRTRGTCLFCLNKLIPSLSSVKGEASFRLDLEGQCSTMSCSG